jgi:hypothetical protein
MTVARDVTAESAFARAVRQVDPAIWCVMLYLLLGALTHTHLTGDAPEYAGEIHDRIRTGNPPAGFWDAGHLAWRPFVFALLFFYRLIGGGGVSLSTVSHVLMGLSWVAGLACAFLLPRWLLRLGASSSASIFATIILLGANAFLSYGQGGSSYIPALGFLLTGLYLLSSEALSYRSSALAGVVLACGVLLWLPFVLSLAGALFAPLLLRAPSRHRARCVGYATATCAVTGVLSYALVAIHLDATSPTSFLAWFSGASHGVTAVAGVARAILGFSRSFLNMGADGASLKRYLLHDPYNPVSRVALLGLGWKMAAFYLVFSTILLMMWRSVWRPRLLFCFVSALPVLLFAIAWQGGDTERYLPLYPAFLLAVAASMSVSAPGAVGGLVSPTFAILLLLVNVPAYSRHKFVGEENTIISRLGAFNDTLLPEGSLLVVPTFNDRTAAYFRSGTIDSRKLHGSFAFHGLVEIGAAGTAQWRSSFARRALDVWDRGGRIWLSRRALSPAPAADWDWVEGDDRRVSWADFGRFFNPFEFGAGLGGPDGFVEILPSAPNKSRLREILAGR